MGMGVYFYEPDTRNGFLSNFYVSPFICEDRLTWQTAEHFYQAHKFSNIDKEAFNRIHQAYTPREAKDLAKEFSKKYDVCEFVKIYNMRGAIRYKFDQNPDIRLKLLETGDNIIIEDSLLDNYWGKGAQGLGINMMGLLLMELRCEIRIG